MNFREKPLTPPPSFSENHFVDFFREALFKTLYKGPKICNIIWLPFPLGTFLKIRPFWRFGTATRPWATWGIRTHNNTHTNISARNTKGAVWGQINTPRWATPLFGHTHAHTHKHISKKHTICGRGSNKHNELRNTRQFDCTFSQTHEHKMKKNVTHSQTPKVWSTGEGSIRH